MERSLAAILRIKSKTAKYIDRFLKTTEMDVCGWCSEVDDEASEKRSRRVTLWWGLWIWMSIEDDVVDQFSDTVKTLNENFEELDAMIKNSSAYDCYIEFHVDSELSDSDTTQEVRFPINLLAVAIKLRCEVEIHFSTPIEQQNM